MVQGFNTFLNLVKHFPQLLAELDLEAGPARRQHPRQQPQIEHFMRRPALLQLINDVLEQTQKNEGVQQVQVHELCKEQKEVFADN